ncbi:uncharacterized protein LOC114525829 [Dendronephthya gigantea]|uniref:uncharacterized protein LOC114525829 n=1 Tax=Dendronephthya gigantea TaxID=151771 RepID=UPI0010698CB6|nr:uncharacterized protein LOC114525829 [Dendronephthya gigantea]
MSYVFSARHMPTAGGSQSKPIVFVIGSSGNVGKATINALSINFGRKLDIRAGVRRPESVSDFKHLTGVTVVKAEMGQCEALLGLFKGVKALLIVTPGTGNRAELVGKTAEAAKSAGVDYIVVISGTTAEKPDTILGKQLCEVEQAVTSLEVPFVILRLPWFMESYFKYKDSIKADLMFHAPVDGGKEFQVVCMDDAGSAAAVVLASPEKHAGKIYTLVSDRNTFEQVSAALTRALSREITYVRMSYEETRQSLQNAGVPELFIEGLLEFYQTIDSGEAQAFGGDEHFKEITGKNPTKLLTWMNRFASAFK